MLANAGHLRQRLAPCDQLLDGLVHNHCVIVHTPRESLNVGGLHALHAHINSVAALELPFGAHRLTRSPETPMSMDIPVPLLIELGHCRAEAGCPAFDLLVEELIEEDAEAIK